MERFSGAGQAFEFIQVSSILAIART